MIGGKNVGYARRTSPKKYSEAAIVDGRRELANGAVAGYVRNAKGERVWRIVKGADSEHMDKIKRKPGQKVARKQITERAAQIAFNAAYGKNWQKSPKGAAIAKGQDLARTHRVVNDTRYTGNPYKYDFRGVDAGPKVYQRTPKQAAQDAARKGKSRAEIFTKKGGYYW